MRIRNNKLINFILEFSQIMLVFLGVYSALMCTASSLDMIYDGKLCLLLSLIHIFARTPEATALRKELVKYFFEIYERACKKSFQDANPPLAVKLFLRYGYVSEELLTEEELRTLLTLPDSREEETTCRVYTMSAVSYTHLNLKYNFHIE